jgi:hypothetical protein
VGLATELHCCPESEPLDVPWKTGGQGGAYVLELHVLGSYDDITIFIEQHCQHIVLQHST